MVDKKSTQIHCCIRVDSEYNLVDMNAYFFFLSSCADDISIGLSLAL